MTGIGMRINHGDYYSKQNSTKKILKFEDEWGILNKNSCPTNLLMGDPFHSNVAQSSECWLTSKTDKMRYSVLTFTSRTTEGVPKDSLFWGAFKLFQGSAGVNAEPIPIDALAPLVNALLLPWHHLTVFPRWWCTRFGHFLVWNNGYKEKKLISRSQNLSIKTQSGIPLAPLPNIRIFYWNSSIWWFPHVFISCPC